MPTWSGYPVEPQNLGAYLETGVTFCLIGDPKHLEALAIIDQADVDLVQTGQKVTLQFDELAGRRLSGTITSISELDMQSAPRELVARGDIPMRVSSTGAPQPASASYQARITLDEPSAQLLAAAPGKAKISVAAQSLGSRLLRYLQQTFQMRD